ncbi:hypothetical protein SAMN06295945_1112 [Polynucleobacter meluiroseus]|uniref:Lipoprotein SmpA/OmlA domain-containing protein n=1 Tax=Polynucleobacter meluiroseus TaxID=1938814 RepID=A0A240DZZ8_9BURK|nr:hypothetical protein [Polynucleobacter meluiroseus]SNX28765.1 hypothetical protein SAMN06295945_1112 [Polynucleobacter meluiroseus]
MNKLTYSFVLMGCCFISACANYAPLATIPARQMETQKLTLGAVQSKIKEGTSSAEVVEVMGSPNIVTSNPDGTETWVYDKFSTESEIAGGYQSAVAVRSTRTFIVTLKFNKNHRVTNVAYRQTSY